MLFKRPKTTAQTFVKPLYYGLLACVLGTILTVVIASSAIAQAGAKSAEKTVEEFKIVYLREEQEKLPPVSMLDLPTEDRGFAGAELAAKDNNTTGRFTGQKFNLEEISEKDPKKLIDIAVDRVKQGAFILADVAPQTLLDMSDAVKDKSALIFNVALHHDRLRDQDCRVNVLHTTPSYAQLADALAQYLAFKKWNRWFMVKGPAPEDELFAEAMRRAAKRYGSRVVEERTYTYKIGARRTDGGYEQIQQQIPKFTQGAPKHDVKVVADEAGLFGVYMPYRGWSPRPVVGSIGLYPTSWHPALELWGGTQFQNRFTRANKRTMRPLDYDAWVAVRTIGEAATRTASTDPQKLIDYIRSKDFELAAFKGLKLTYRDWNGQLRQPILVATDRLHVSVSPQPQYLHRFSELDTLGIDRPNSQCKAFQ